jgi:sulfatase maturation enzyme AslB (radical SAM superfamily)
MTFDTAIKCIDEVCDGVEKNATIEFLFFGGEPLLRFDLIRDVVDFVSKLDVTQKCRFFASTNGVLLSEEMKSWFVEHKEKVVLGLSLDGTRNSHNYNRSNSFDKIDIPFFKNTWPTQNVKMTVSEHTLMNYAEDVIYLHSLGFGINGGDVCLGNSTWQNRDLLQEFGKQLMRLVDYYSNYEIPPYNALLDIDIAACTSKKREKVKLCGVGDKLYFFDTDGKTFPCTFITPMTFSNEDLAIIGNVDFKDVDQFTDGDCYTSCYLYPICKRCPAENYLHNHSFKLWNKDKCGFTEVLALAASEIEARRIINNPSIYDETKIYYTIEAIKTIRELYLLKHKNIINFT